MESGSNIWHFSVRRRRSVDIGYVDDVEGQSEMAGSEGTPSSSRKIRKMCVVENSDDDVKQSLKEDLVVNQNKEAEKVELKREKILLEWERLNTAKESMDAEKKYF